MGLCSTCYYYHFPEKHKCKFGIESLDVTHVGDRKIVTPSGVPDTDDGTCNKYEHYDEHGLPDKANIDQLRLNTIKSRTADLPYNEMLDCETLWEQKK
jgi:hypothetical protein